MTRNLHKKSVVSTGATLLAAVATVKTAESRAAVAHLIEKIKGKDDKARTEAWQNAGSIGAEAIQPLAALLSDPDPEVARAAKRGLWKIVHTVGRPGADPEKKAVAGELLLLLKYKLAVQREAIWMLSEIGGDEAVAPLADLLLDKEAREDARAALQRIPGEKSVAALQKALASGPEDFRPAVAEALRARGAKVEGYPSQKLVPSRQTSVKTGA